MGKVFFMPLVHGRCVHTDTFRFIPLKQSMNFMTKATISAVIIILHYSLFGVVWINTLFPLTVESLGNKTQEVL